MPEATRSVVLQVWDEKYNTPRDKIAASSIAGAVGGCTGGLLSKVFSLSI